MANRQLSIDQECLTFLATLHRDNMLTPFLKMAKTHVYDIIRMGAPTAASVTKAIGTLNTEMRRTTAEEINRLKTALSETLQNKVKEVVEDLGLPSSEQVNLANQLISNITPLLEQIVIMQKSPVEKGRHGELELLSELADYFPEDEFQHLGKSGDTDIIGKPRFNGSSLSDGILIESKRNSDWRRSYIEEVQKHLEARNKQYAILAVETMPQGANGYLHETSPQGVIFITSRENCKLAYGALRSVLIAYHTLEKKTLDIRKALTDKKISEAINEVYQYEKHLKTIRMKAGNIATNVKGLTQATRELDECLKHGLKQLQQRITEAIEDISNQGFSPE